MGQSPKIARRERQIVRILALLRLLGQGRSPSVRELAAEFHTRRETIYRDLRVLQDAGYPIAGDEQGRLSRPRLLSSRVPEIHFSPAETDALLMAAAQAQIALPDAQSFVLARSKVKAIAQSGNGVSRQGEPAETFEAWSSGSKDYRVHEERIGLLLEAILRKRRCRVTYKAPSRPHPKTYEFDAYRLLLIGGGLYVVGQVPKHAGTATLAIDRLLSVALLETAFEPDPAFDSWKCRLDAFGVSWENPMDVALRFRADQAPYVRERLWHSSQKITDLPGGAVELSFRAGGPFEVRRWILGWGDAVEVIAPQVLRKEIRRILRSAISLYRAR